MFFFVGMDGIGDDVTEIRIFKPGDLVHGVEERLVALAFAVVGNILEENVIEEPHIRMEVLSPHIVVDATPSASVIIFTISENMVKEVRNVGTLS